MQIAGLPLRSTFMDEKRADRCSDPGGDACLVSSSVPPGNTKRTEGRTEQYYCSAAVRNLSTVSDFPSGLAVTQSKHRHLGCADGQAFSLPKWGVR